MIGPRMANMSSNYHQRDLLGPLLRGVHSLPGLSAPWAGVSLGWGPPRLWALRKPQEDPRDRLEPSLGSVGTGALTSCGFPCPLRLCGWRLQLIMPCN